MNSVVPRLLHVQSAENAFQPKSDATELWIASIEPTKPAANGSLKGKLEDIEINHKTVKRPKNEFMDDGKKKKKKSNITDTDRQRKRKNSKISRNVSRRKIANRLKRTQLLILF